MLSHGGAVESIAIDYYLSIIPVLFEFRSHDRIEMSLSDEVLPRLDRGANRLAEHDDRLAVLEQRTAHHGPGSGR